MSAIPVAFIVADSTQAGARCRRGHRGRLRRAALHHRPGHAHGPGAAPLVWPDAPNNLVFDWEIGEKAATDALFAKAAHVTS